MSEEVHEIRGIGDYVIDCYTEYGNYVNIHRHVPRWEDGLKPVYKRVMLCALDIACGKKVKTATLIGRTIGCFVGDTELLDVNNQGLKLSDLSKRDLEKDPVYTFSFTMDGIPKISRVVRVWSSGFREDLVRVTLDNGKSFCCTKDHKILTREGYKEAGKLQYMEDLIPVVTDKRTSAHCMVMSVEPVKEGAEVFDVEVDLDEHNFSLACGCVAKNCYHPHGDAALNDVIAELVRSGLLIGQGNFGYKSMFRWDDNSPAAPRYTEVKVNPKYETLIKQLLPYVPSHINDLGNIEADYLPTPCVLSLAMGSFGIGLGVTVNIPSFTMESLIKAGYAAILGKPKPWKLLQPGFDLQMSDEDKETFWNNEKGRLTYKFDVEPKTIGGLNGWSIIGDPSFVKPKLQQLFKLKDEGGKVVILDQSHDNIREVFIARSKRIKTITDSEVEMKVREAAEVTKAFSLSVIYNGQTRPITGGTWIQNCMLNYNSLVKRFREDKVNKINLDIEVFTHFREVADRILETEDSYEKIQSDLHLSFGVVEKIAKMSISTLRELDPERRIKKLEGERKYYEDLTTKAVLKEFLK